MNILGVDVGSTIAKFAFFENGKTSPLLFSKRVNGDPIECVNSFVEEHSQLLSNCHIAVTGSSRNLIGSHLNAELIKPEILAHVYGVWSKNIYPDVIIEIGGQDSKLILLKKNTITNFRMNANCAAGTGAFIESQARRYGVSVKEMDELSKTTNNVIKLNAKCATFLESTLIDLQRKGIKRDALYSSIFDSLCNNYLSSLASDLDFNNIEQIVFVGGVAKIDSMKSGFERIIGKMIYVPQHCEFMGAIGIANMLQLELRNKDALYDGKYSTEAESIQCDQCENRCLLQGINIDGKFYYVGGLCGRSISR